MREQLDESDAGLLVLSSVSADRIRLGCFAHQRQTDRPVNYRLRQQYRIKHEEGALYVARGELRETSLFRPQLNLHHDVDKRPSRRAVFGGVVSSVSDGIAT